MSKKVLCSRVVVAYAILSASVFSMGVPYEKSGFYTGLSAGIGYNASNFNGEGTRLNGLMGAMDLRSHRGRISTCGFEKDLDGFVGYMMHLPRRDWMAGIEFGFEKPFYKKHFDNALWGEVMGIPIPGVYKCRVKTLYVAKLHAKIGKILNGEWFVYSLAGVDMKKIETFMEEGPVGKINAKKCIFGLAIGLGAEREISTNWHLGLELVNTYYPSKTFGVDNLHFRGNEKVKANTTQVALRLIYSF